MSYRFVDSFRPGPGWNCSKTDYKPVLHTPLLSVQWMNSWWWTEELPETCRVSCQNKFVKLVHLVGFIIRKFVTMHGHMSVKFIQQHRRILRLPGLEHGGILILWSFYISITPYQSIGRNVIQGSKTSVNTAARTLYTLTLWLLCEMTINILYLLLIESIFIYFIWSSEWAESISVVESQNSHRIFMF